MTYRSCLEAFEDGVHSRLNYPLHMGLYKLSESYRRIQYVRDEVVRVAEVVNGKRSPFSLRSCTNEDKAYWLRDVPINVAYRLGYEIIPGLRALEFDDVPKGQSEAAALQVESKIPADAVKVTVSPVLAPGVIVAPKAAGSADPSNDNAAST